MSWAGRCGLMGGPILPRFAACWRNCPCLPFSFRPARAPRQQRGRQPVEQEEVITDSPAVVKLSCALRGSSRVSLPLLAEASVGASFGERRGGCLRGGGGAPAGRGGRPPRGDPRP